MRRLVDNLKAQGAYKGTLNVEYREFAKIYDPKMINVHFDVADLSAEEYRE